MSSQQIVHIYTQIETSIHFSKSNVLYIFICHTFLYFAIISSNLPSGILDNSFIHQVHILLHIFLMQMLPVMLSVWRLLRQNYYDVVSTEFPLFRNKNVIFVRACALENIGIFSECTPKYHTSKSDWHSISKL